MTETEMHILALKGMVADLPAEDQAKIKETCEKLRAVLKEAGEHGGIALTLVATETANS